MRLKNTLDAKEVLKVRNARLDRDWTQEQLAIYCGLSRETVNLVENGKRWTRAIRKIQRALGLHILQPSKNGLRTKR